MNTKETKTVSRRSALRTSLRYGVGGLMALTVGLFARRRQINRENACVDPKGHTGCRGCGVLKGCSLPRALSFKQFLQRQNGKTNS